MNLSQNQCRIIEAALKDDAPEKLAGVIRLSEDVKVPTNSSAQTRQIRLDDIFTLESSRIGQNLLQHAARLGGIKCIQAIFASSMWNDTEKQEALVTRNRCAHYVFYLAASNGHLEVVEWLWNQYQSEEIQQEALASSNHFSLKWAASNGHLKVVEWLWNRYKDPTTQQKILHDALSWAAKNDHILTALFLFSVHQDQEAALNTIRAEEKSSDTFKLSEFFQTKPIQRYLEDLGRVHSSAIEEKPINLSTPTPLEQQIRALYQAALSPEIKRFFEQKTFSPLLSSDVKPSIIKLFGSSAPEAFNFFVDNNTYALVQDTSTLEGKAKLLAHIITHVRASNLHKAHEITNMELVSTDEPNQPSSSLTYPATTQLKHLEEDKSNGSAPCVNEVSPSFYSKQKISNRR